jgi:glycosyltransferase involved in cell wall biosynthesis
VPSQRKKLLVLTSTFPRWRDDTDPPFVFELCRRLSTEFDVRVLTPRTRGSATHEIIDGVEVQRYPYFFEPCECLTGEGGILAKIHSNRRLLLLVPFLMCGLALALRRECRNWNPDAVHAHWLIPQGVVAALAMPSGIPLVCTSHGSDVHALKGWLWNSVRKFVIRHSAATVGVSTALSATIASATNSSTVVHTIPMGIDTKSRFRIGAEQDRKDSELLFVGRLVKGKGLHVLLSALPQIALAAPNVTLRVVGSGPEDLRLRALSSSLGLDNRVTFEGGVQNDRLASFYQQATMLVAPYTGEEGLGLISAEALACGCAVVSADLPAIQDIVRHGETGLLFRKMDKDHMSRQILHLLANPETRRQLARNGRAHVIDNFDWSITATRYQALLMSQISRSSE